MLLEFYIYHVFFSKNPKMFSFVILGFLLHTKIHSALRKFCFDFVEPQRNLKNECEFLIIIYLFLQSTKWMVHFTCARELSRYWGNWWRKQWLRTTTNSEMWFVWEGFYDWNHRCLGTKTTWQDEFKHLVCEWMRF